MSNEFHWVKCGLGSNRNLVNEFHWYKEALHQPTGGWESDNGINAYSELTDAKDTDGGQLIEEWFQETAWVGDTIFGVIMDDDRKILIAASEFKKLLIAHWESVCEGWDECEQHDEFIQNHRQE